MKHNDLELTGSQTDSIRINASIPPADLPATPSLDVIPDHLFDAVNSFIDHFDESVKLQVVNVPPRSCVLIFLLGYSIKFEIHV